MHYRLDMILHERSLVNWWHWWRQVNSMLVEFHLSETNRPYRARTWTARMTDRDANHYAISHPPLSLLSGECLTVSFRHAYNSSADHYHILMQINFLLQACISGYEAAM